MDASLHHLSSAQFKGAFHMGHQNTVWGRLLFAQSSNHLNRHHWADILPIPRANLHASANTINNPKNKSNFLHVSPVSDAAFGGGKGQAKPDPKSKKPQKGTLQPLDAAGWVSVDWGAVTAKALESVSPSK